jgi:hypothetical protein
MCAYGVVVDGEDEFALEWFQPHRLPDLIPFGRPTKSLNKRADSFAARQFPPQNSAAIFS